MNHELQRSDLDDVFAELGHIDANVKEGLFGHKVVCERLYEIEKSLDNIHKTNVALFILGLVILGVLVF